MRKFERLMNKKKCLLKTTGTIYVLMYYCTHFLVGSLSCHYNVQKFLILQIFRDDYET